MSNVFTLEDLDNEIKKRYQPFVFQAGEEEFTLVSLLRVPKKVRTEVQERLTRLRASADEKDEVDEDETVDALKFALTSVTQNKRGPALARAIGDDLVRWSTLMEMWQEQTQPGEASSSPS